MPAKASLPESEATFQPSPSKPCTTTPVWKSKRLCSKLTKSLTRWGMNCCSKAITWSSVQWMYVTLKSLISRPDSVFSKVSTSPLKSSPTHKRPPADTRLKKWISRPGAIYKGWNWRTWPKQKPARSSCWNSRLSPIMLKSQERPLPMPRQKPKVMKFRQMPSWRTRNSRPRLIWLSWNRNWKTKREN